MLGNVFLRTFEENFILLINTNKQNEKLTFIVAEFSISRFLCMEMLKYWNLCISVISEILEIQSSGNTKIQKFCYFV